MQSCVGCFGGELKGRVDSVRMFINNVSTFDRVDVVYKRVMFNI